MKNIILIHAHKDLFQLNQLIDALTSQNHIIYVNIDLKSKIDLGQINTSAKLIKKRNKIYWSDFTQVEAILNSLLEIEKDNVEYGHIAIISAQDYPIVSNAKIFEKIEPGKEYLNYALIAKHAWDCEDRFQYYHFRKNKYFMKLSAYLIKVMKMIGWKRKMMPHYLPYGGSSWWMITKSCVAYILQHVKNNPQYTHFFRRVACADELFFHTLILNSSFKENVINTSFHYIDWTNCVASPNILLEKDFEKIMASDKLFCRKVSLPESNQLIEKLDHYRKAI
jgi:Core-2/I-Branching enzyme